MMADISVDELEQNIVDELEHWARINGRSLEEEVTRILHAAAEEQTRRRIGSIAEVQALFVGQTFSDSAPLQREDRER